ncbi:hypothetical protein KP509_12G036600 [Ceratopteris richardii]|nr:hypothetical protein KP509_12G036600 [Ceratopteris richardii]KAH7423035.1 hypothetical protein KP509_12G036600 [Ceratopteris richardii]KAH7423039.1 hypothetical protein KP509_12G036600 [Ceratopteris richardii]
MMGLYSTMPIILLYFWLLITTTDLATSQDGYTPHDEYLIKCGYWENATIDDRGWQGDFTFSGLLSSSSRNSINASTTNSSIGALFNTARIFTNRASYVFRVSEPGRFWVRLYFYPFNFETFTTASADFSVMAGEFTLLANVKPSTDNVISTPSIYEGMTGLIFKEYNLNVTESSLEVSFIPSSNTSYAFINAIEVVSCPFGLVIDEVYSLPNASVSSIGLPFMALETMHRINVGGPLITPSNDTSGLQRTWLGDEHNLLEIVGWTPINDSTTSIIYGSGISVAFAPPLVYSTALELNSTQGVNGQPLNLSWIFPIKSNYMYLIRLHFCELVYATSGKRDFNVYIQNQTAYKLLDLGASPGQYHAKFIDFSVTLQQLTTLFIQVGAPPNSESAELSDAIMNGIEVWKLSNSDKSLDGVSAGLPPSNNAKNNLAPVIGGVAGGGAAFLLVVLVICCFCRQRAKVVKHPMSSWVPLPVHGGGHSISVISKTTAVSGAGSYASSAQSSMGRIFTFTEISEATHNFDETLVIGVGGFGKVYQGEFEDGSTVAIKRGNPRSEQGIMEFRTEIDMLSKLRHRHLVSLIGYCNENREMILVYEFMANGPLRSHLYGTNLPPLSWRQRLEICIGSARGLHYLHTGANESIIHRDVKTTNILLDDNFVAKVSDFGLSKTGPSLDQTHVSTAVKGSFGYLDPEYFRRQQLTDKSDVYSFGVVLMEVLCARPAINPALPRDQVNIAEWAMQWQKRGTLDQIIDPHLVGAISMESLAKFGEIAEKCLAENGSSRPSMGQVLWSLEHCLQLQDASVTQEGNEENADRISELPTLPPVQEEWELNAVMDNSFGDDDQEDATMSAVFSRMVRPNAN